MSLEIPDEFARESCHFGISMCDHEFSTRGIGATTVPTRIDLNVCTKCCAHHVYAHCQWHFCVGITKREDIVSAGKTIISLTFSTLFSLPSRGSPECIYRETRAERIHHTIRVNSISPMRSSCRPKRTRQLRERVRLFPVDFFFLFRSPRKFRSRFRDLAARTFDARACAFPLTL